jgi:hypothetical protein
MLYTIEAGRERQNCKLTELELGCADLMKMKYMIDGFFFVCSYFQEDYEDLFCE